MKVFRNGTEVKNAKVEYGPNGQPQYVTANGLRQRASAFTIEDEKPVKKTRKAPASRKK